MFWNTSERHIKEPIQVSDIKNKFHEMNVNPTGGTDISVAIKAIPDSWYQKNTNIFIVTDGEINQDRYNFNSQVFSLIKRYVNINIITVENNNSNYLNNNVDAGSEIFKILQKNKQTKYIRKFECFNEYHENESFVNFYNPEVNKDEFSYEGYVFSDSKFNDFVNIICQIINKNINNKDYLNKVMYNLSFTIFYYTKSKSQKIRNEIIKLFSTLFEEVNSDTSYLTKMFSSEINSHVEGACNTYQQYRENRKQLFEKTLDDLQTDVMSCFHSGKKFMSFIIPTKDSNVKKIIESNDTNTYVRLSDTYFNNAGIHYNNHHLPMLSIFTKSNDGGNQALRQWIRAIYSRIHKIQVNDERILYLLLTDMMSVVLSDLPDHIKKGYKNCARIMLEAKRFNSGDLKQIVFLSGGNKPKPMISGYFTMDEIWTQCRSHFTQSTDITLDELWYGICLAYDNDRLIKAQLPNDCDRDLLLSKLRSLNPSYLYEQIEIENKVNYQDYITLEDISTTGGYKFPDYTYGNKTYKSQLLMSQATYDNFVETSTDNSVNCPITGNLVKLENFIKIPPLSNDTTSYNDSDFNMNIFNKEFYQRIDLHKADKMNLTDLELHPTSYYDFTNYPYEFYPSIPLITEKLYKEKEQYLNIDDFKNQVTQRFEWLNEINMENTVIAGGFNKSIILDEKVNDIDIYFHHNEDDTVCDELLHRTIKDITTALSKRYDNLVYLVAYKKEFNVYELIYFENINGPYLDSYEVQNLTQMKFIAKIQIVMKKHKEPKDIFNTYDIDACNVLYDSNNLYFNDRSYTAYRYLVSVPRCTTHYTDTFDSRLLKYYKSGFRIALPGLTIDQVKDKLDNDNNLVINKCKFHVQEIDNNNIYINKHEFIIEKHEKNLTAKLDQSGVRIYDTIIGELGSLDDSRSIVKFMRYVQRQNRLVERVKRKLNDGEEVNEEILLSEINVEMKSELKDKLQKLKLTRKKYIKGDALLSDNETETDDESDSDDNDSNNEKDKEYDIIEAQIEDIKLEIKEDQVDQPTEEVKEDQVDQSTEEVKEDQVDQSTEEIKQPEEYIKVYYRVSTPNETRPMNEFDNGTCDMKFILGYEDFYKSKDWYNSNVENDNKIIEEKERLYKEQLAKEKAEKEQLEGDSNTSTKNKDDSNSESDSDSNSESDSESDSDSNSESESELESEPEPESDHDSDAGYSVE